MTKIDGLALRRRIAEAKGWNLRLSRRLKQAIREFGRDPDMNGIPPGQTQQNISEGFPCWDSDPVAALGLWAELVIDGELPYIREGFGCTEAGVAAFGEPPKFDPVEVSEVGEPDPVRRFCLALCLLWLSWHESKKVAT